jgi:quercetin dioxygenase-like cupin family protein
MHGFDEAVVPSHAARSRRSPTTGRLPLTSLCGVAFKRGACIAITLAATGVAADATRVPRPILPEDLHWASPPGVAAVEGAWVLGSESGSGPYLFRVRIAKGGRIPPHVHPDDRHTTVLEGTLYAGFGETFDESALVAVPAGAVYVAPRGVAHYLWAKDGAVVYQEGGFGPTGTHFR